MKLAAFALIILGSVMFAAGQIYTTPVVVPQYAAQYQPSALQPQYQSQDIYARLASIEHKLDEILKIARDQPETVPPVGASTDSVPRPIDYIKSAAAKCAGCHHADIFEQKGGGFQLFTPEGNFAKLTNRDKRKVVEMVDLGKMPPPESGKSITPEEKKALTAIFRAAVQPAPPPTVPAQPNGQPPAPHPLATPSPVKGK